MTLHVSSSDKAPRRRRGKKERIYLKEPYDYFRVNYYMRKMGEKLESETGPEGRLGSDVPDNSSKPTLPSQHWRAFDLHNKPRGLYSEEDKRIAAELYYQKSSSSNPQFSPDLSTKLKVFFGLSSSTLNKFKMEAEPLMGRPRFNSYSTCSSSEVSSSRSRTVSESSTESWKKQVHFSPETVFCERDFKSPFWTNILERRRLQAQERADREEKERPRPFLPYLESGLSYHDDEEFYRLKNSQAHRNKAQLELMRENFRGRKAQGSSSFQGFVANFFKGLSCCYRDDVVYKAKASSVMDGAAFGGPYHKKQKTKWI